MGKKTLLLLLTASCFISVITFLYVLAGRHPDGSQLQTAVTNSNVSVTVRSGSLIFSKTPAPSMAAVTASPDSQTTTGTLGTLEVTDLRGTRGVGWTVNLDSMLDYANADGSGSIPLANTQLTARDMNVVKGDPAFVSIPGGTLAPADSNGDHALDSAITLASTSSAVSGKTYNGINLVSFGVDLALTIPGGLPADTYTSTYVISVQ